jgi:hypothetical protein
MASANVYVYVKRTGWDRATDLVSRSVPWTSALPAGTDLRTPDDRSGGTARVLPDCRLPISRFDG